MTQDQINLILCAIGVITLVAVLYTNSRQPIDVYFSIEEIREGLCDDHAKKDYSNKKKTIKAKTQQN